MNTPFALTGISVVTGDETGRVHDGWTVVVDQHGIIEFAGSSAQARVPVELLSIDGTGKYVIPGLINAHAHLFSDGRLLPPILLHPRTQGAAAWFLRSTAGQKLLRKRSRDNAITQLHSGVTTLRSVGDVAYEVVATRDAISRGDHPGPRILPSGPLMAITGGHGAPQIALIGEDPRQARDNARKNIRHGVEAIKISATGGVTDALAVGYAGKPEMPEASMRAVCEEAHDTGVLVAAHAQSREGVLAALRAGVDTIEHGSSMSDEIIALYRDNPRSLRGSSALIPTLQACLPLVRLARDVTGVSEVVHANAEMVLGEMLSGIRSALDNGIRVGMGTDSGVSYVTHANTWREMDYLQRFGGISPEGVLHAATQGNARILGLDAVTGSIAVGRAADLVVLEDSPLESFRHLASPWMVVARGERIARPEISRIPEIDAQLDTI